MLACIGASAGGLDALESFFRAVPADSGVAFAVVQHLDPRHPSALPELLARATTMPVDTVADGARPEPNRVYVIPPGALLTVPDGAFRLEAATQPSLRSPIDRLFRSAAQEYRERAVGILLSGSGSDGTTGLRAIKERDGLTLVQAPETARHDSMPRSAIDAGLADEVLAPDQLASRLLDHARFLQGLGHAGPGGSAAEVSARLNEICALLRSRTGHDFSGYKEGTLLRRIQRRLQVNRVAAVEDYLRLLGEEGGLEADALLKDLLIGVTEYFRNPEAFQALAHQVIPRIVQGRAADAPVRVWVPGCASGQEVYSLAMLLRESLDRAEAQPFVQIFATDLDAELLAEARRGRYGADIAAQVSPERLARFFLRDGDGFQASKELRDMCIFSQHNLIRDPPFSQLDLISCRNVLIYLSGELQRRLLPVFHYALRPGGFLFLGPSEGVTAASGELFATVDKSNRIFRRSEPVTRPILDFPLIAFRSEARAATPPALPPRATAARDATTAAAAADSSRERVGAAFERLLREEYTAASAVITERGDALFIAGPLSTYLQLPAGAAGAPNLLESLRGGLRHELRMALRAAGAQRRKVVRAPVAVEVLADAPARRVRLTVRPLPAIDPSLKVFAVVLEEAPAPDLAAATAAAAVGDDDLSVVAAAGAELELPAVEQLEDELRATRAELKSTVEELESANEALKSSNEELISTNEELQSANEELQTGKEELQSLNEELETVNTELREKVEELGTANSDLRNLFASTQIATLFLDRELKVTRFTPAATALFHLIETDLGRSIGDLAPQFVGEDLVADAREVLRSGQGLERAVRSSAQADRWFILRVLPYQALANVVAGVVVTLVDVSELKRAEEALRQSEERFRLLVEGVKDYAIFMLAPDGTVASWNAGAERLKGYRPEEVVGQPIARFYTEQDQRAGRPRAMLEAAALKGHAEDEGWHLRRDGSRFWANALITALRDPAGTLQGFAEVVRDFTEHKRMVEEARRHAELLKLSHDAILVWRLDGGIETWNRGAEELYGYGAEEARGRVSHELLQTRFPQPWPQIEAELRERRRWDGELLHRTQGGQTVTVSAKLQVVRGDDGVERVLESNRDITAAKRAEEALRESEARFRTMADAIPQLAWIANADGYIHWYNQRWYQYTGTTPAQMEGWGWQSVHDPNELPKVLERWKGSIATGEPFDMVFPLRGADGRFRPFLTRVLPLKDAERHVVQWFGTNTDVTERIEIERALVRQTNALEAINRIFRETLTRETEENLGRLCLTVAEELTHSRFGFIGVINEETGKLDDLAISDPGWELCRIPNPVGHGRRVPIGFKIHGIYGRVLLDGKAFYTNDPASHPDRIGMPEGHPPLHAFLGVPLVHAGKTIGMFAVGNREGGYGPEQLQAAEALAPAITQALLSKHADEERRRARLGLDQLARASLSVMRETDLERMLQAIAEAALALTHAGLASCGHGYVNGRFLVGGSARVPGAPACPPGGDMYAVDKGGVHMALTEGAEAIRLTDEQLRAHAKWWGLPEGHVPMRGLLGVRMVSRNGQTSGVILVTDKQRGEFGSDFTAEDESLLRQLATVASLALQHVEARISLEESDRRKNEFLAMLSHELRNPLAPLRNSIYILDRAAPGSVQAKRAQSVIDRQVGHMTRLVDDLLDVTRISRGKFQLQRALVDFTDVVRRAVDDQREAFEANGIALRLSLPSAGGDGGDGGAAAPIIAVEGDRTRIAQVIGNLLHNASKFTPAGGRVEVEVEANRALGQAVARVRDTGVGIAPEMLTRVFEPFTQADTTLDRNQGGLGLGLALVKGLVEMHGGTASVQSEGPGKGAEFTVRFPLRGGPDYSDRGPRSSSAESLDGAASGVEAPSPSDGGRRQRVLIVEDNVDAANSLREVLELTGRTVAVAYSGPEGLERARVFRPEVVVCDIGLPGLTGYEVARALKADPALRPLRVVALSGYAAPDEVAKAREAGFDLHLAKPPDLEKLEAALSMTTESRPPRPPQG